MPPTKARNPFGRRLEHAMQCANLGYNELDRAAGRGNGYTSKTISSPREKKPHAETIDKLAEATGFEFRWLALGRGRMRQTGTVKPRRVPFKTRFRDLPGWATAEGDARQDDRNREIDWAIRGAGDLEVFGMPRPGRLTATFVARLALIFADISTDEMRERLENEESASRQASGHVVTMTPPPPPHAPAAPKRAARRR